MNLVNSGPSFFDVTTKSQTPGFLIHQHTLSGHPSLQFEGFFLPVEEATIAPTIQANPDNGGLSVRQEFHSSQIPLAQQNLSDGLNLNLNNLQAEPPPTTCLNDESERITLCWGCGNPIMEEYELP